MAEASPVGVLLMAYGGPESLDDVPGYLADIRAGRSTPKHVVEEIAIVQPRCIVVMGERTLETLNDLGLPEETLEATFDSGEQAVRLAGHVVPLHPVCPAVVHDAAIADLYAERGHSQRRLELDWLSDVWVDDESLDAVASRMRKESED